MNILNFLGILLVMKILKFLGKIGFLVVLHKLIKGFTVRYENDLNVMLRLGFEPWTPVSNTGTLPLY